MLNFRGSGYRSEKAEEKELWHWLNADCLAYFAVCWLFFLEEATEAVSPNCQKVMEKVHDNLQGEKLQSRGHWWNHSKWTHTVHSTSLRIYTINGCKTHFPCKSLQLRLWAGEGGTCSPLSASCSISHCFPSFPSLCNWVLLCSHLAKGLELALPFQLLVQPSVLGGTLLLYPGLQL